MELCYKNSSNEAFYHWKYDSENESIVAIWKKKKIASETAKISLQKPYFY